MKKHTITDELLRELHSEADLPLREKIEKEVPELVEPSLSDAIAEYEKAHEKFLNILKNE